MHFNAVQKELLGWLNYGGSPPITTVQTSGVYTIEPFETAGSNPKALKVKTPSGTGITWSPGRRSASTRRCWRATRT